MRSNKADRLLAPVVSFLLHLHQMCVLIWSSASLFCLFLVTPEVPCLFSVNISSCYPDCRVPSSPQEQTNSISTCQSAALREPKLSAETNRDRQPEKEMQEKEAGKQWGGKRGRWLEISDVWCSGDSESGGEIYRYGKGCRQGEALGSSWDSDWRAEEKWSDPEFNTDRKTQWEKWSLTGGERKM